MVLRLLRDLQSHARLRPDAVAARPAGVAGKWALTWCELDRKLSAVSTSLARRGAVGGTIVFCYPNSSEYIAGFLAVLAASRHLFPLAFDAPPLELQAASRRAGAAAAIIHRQALSSLGGSFRATHDLPEISDDAVLLTDPIWPASNGNGPALLLQSSGTTAEPKIVLRDGASLDAVSANIVRACGFSADDHVLAAVPLCHSYGLEHGILAPIAAGSCVHVCERFDLSVVLPEIRGGGITLFPGVPFMFEMLIHAGNAVAPTLRRAWSAGGPLPRATFDAFLAKFGLRVSQLYGATEIGSVTFNDPESAGFDPAGVGTPMDGVSIRILDADEPRIEDSLPAGMEGQVAIAAPSMLRSYVGADPPPLIDGHFLTGDLGLIDDRGALSITGRLKLQIDVGGRKVNPAEVESVLCQHPDVGSCVVLPMRLSETVCRLKAIVTRARPDVEISALELRRFVRERLSGYKVPRLFEVRDALPVSPSGKVLRRRVEAS